MTPPPRLREAIKVNHNPAHKGRAPAHVIVGGSSGGGWSACEADEPALLSNDGVGFFIFSIMATIIINLRGGGGGGGRFR